MSAPQPFFTQPGTIVGNETTAAAPVSPQMDALVNAVSRGAPALAQSYINLRRSQRAADARAETANRREIERLGEQLAQRFDSMEAIVESGELGEGEIDPRLRAVIDDGLGRKLGNQAVQEILNGIEVAGEFDGINDPAEFEGILAGRINEAIDGTTPEYEAAYRDAFDRQFGTIANARRRQLAPAAEAEREQGVRAFIQTGIAEAQEAGDLAGARADIQGAIDAVVRYGGLQADDFDQIVDALADTAVATQDASILSILPTLSIDGAPISTHPDFIDSFLAAHGKFVKSREDTLREDRQERQAIEDQLRIRALEADPGAPLPEEIVSAANSIGFDVSSFRNTAVAAQAEGRLGQADRDRLTLLAAHGQITISELALSGLPANEVARLGELVNDFNRDGVSILDATPVENFIGDQLRVIRSVKLPDDFVAKMLTQMDPQVSQGGREYNVLLEQARSRVRSRLQVEIIQALQENPALITPEGAEDFAKFTQGLSDSIVQEEVAALDVVTVQVLNGGMPISNPNNERISIADLSAIRSTGEVPDGVRDAYDRSNPDRHGLSFPQWLTRVAK